MIYKSFYKLRIYHTYYTKGYAKNFTIRPTEETRQLLKRFRMLFREVENGFDVLSPMVSGVTPLIDLGVDKKMSFALYSISPSFLNITELDSKTNYNEIYYIDNLSLGNATELTTNNWTFVKSKPALFNYGIESSASEIQLLITDPFNDTMYNDDMDKNEKQFSYLVDIGNRSPGKYSFKPTIDGMAQATESFYVSDDLMKDRPLMVLDFFSSELSYASTKTYTLQFEAKKTQWKYVVTLNKDYTGNTISIRDTKDTPTVAFKKVDGTTLTKGSTLAFESVKVANANSAEKIPFSEAPVSDFDLIIKKDDNGDETEIKYLPNPSIQSPKQEMYLSI